MSPSFSQHSNPIFYEADVPTTPVDGRSKGYEPKLPLATKNVNPKASLPSHGDLFDIEAGPSGGAEHYELKKLKALPDWNSARPFLTNLCLVSVSSRHRVFLALSPDLCFPPSRAPCPAAGCCCYFGPTACCFWLSRMPLHLSCAAIPLLSLTIKHPGPWWRRFKCITFGAGRT